MDIFAGAGPSSKTGERCRLLQHPNNSALNTTRINSSSLNSLSENVRL